MGDIIAKGVAYTLAVAVLLIVIYAFVWPVILGFIIGIHYALYTPFVRLMLYISYHVALRMNLAKFADDVARANLLAWALLLEALTVLLIAWKLWRP